MKFSFQIGDKVEIIELQRPGRIKSIWVCEIGIKYQVRYFYNGKAEEDYFYVEELLKK